MKFDGLEPRPAEDIKGIVVPEILKSFVTFEKQACGWGKMTWERSLVSMETTRRQVRLWNKVPCLTLEFFLARLFL